MPDMKWWVFTPPYGDVFSYGSDCVEVQAATKKQALVLGLQKLRLERSRWIHDMESDRRCPFNGLKAEPDA